MQKTDKTIISSVTLLGSLCAYLYAKEAGKDATAYVMVGGFLGSLVGEIIADKVSEVNNSKTTNEIRTIR